MIPQFGAREYETSIIELYVTVREPRSVGVRADEQEHMADTPPHLFARLVVAPVRRFKNAVVALKQNYFTVSYQFNIRESRDALKQVTRHGGLEARAAYHKP